MTDHSWLPSAVVIGYVRDCFHVKLATRPKARQEGSNPEFHLMNAHSRRSVTSPLLGSTWPGRWWAACSTKPLSMSKKTKSTNSCRVGKASTRCQEPETQELNGEAGWSKGAVANGCLVCSAVAKGDISCGWAVVEEMASTPREFTVSRWAFLNITGSGRFVCSGLSSSTVQTAIDEGGPSVCSCATIGRFPKCRGAINPTMGV